MSSSLLSALPVRGRPRRGNASCTEEGSRRRVSLRTAAKWLLCLKCRLARYRRKPPTGIRENDEPRDEGVPVPRMPRSVATADGQCSGAMAPPSLCPLPEWSSQVDDAGSKQCSVRGISGHRPPAPIRGLWCASFLGAANLHRPTPCCRGRSVPRRLGNPCRGRGEFGCTGPIPKRVAISRGGCLLSTLQNCRCAPVNARAPVQN